MIFILVGCILGGEKVSGRGSEVENEVYGVLVASNGKAVAGARVVAIPTASAVVADTDTVITDVKGRYGFDSLPAGSYNLLGQYKTDSLVVLIPDVDVEGKGKGTNVGTDTLLAPGRIRGRLLAGTRGKAGVMAFVSSLSKFDVSDDSGRFEISGLPKGTYAVRYNAPGLLIAPDAGVPVKSGETTILPDKQVEYDPALSPPEPLGLRAVYDTLNERVLLSWESVPVSDLDGFVIYRDDPAFLDPKPLADGFTEGTTFVDSSPPGASDPGGAVVVYRLKSRDKKLNQSLVFSDPVKVRVVSRSLATTTLSGEASGLVSGAYSPMDTVKLIVRFANPGRTLKMIEWDAPSAGVSTIHAVDSRQGSDTLGWITTGPGDYVFSISAKDDAGKVWQTELHVPVVSDPPAVLAGKDTTVSLRDTVRLLGRASDVHGIIRKMEWDIGGMGEFAISKDGAAVFAAPGIQGPVTCVFRAVDDDGNVSTATTLVNVEADPPRVSAGNDTSVTIKDTVRLAGIGQDRFGSIVAWQWLCDGGFLAKSSQASWAAPGVPSDGIRCIVTGTDDDGIEGRDTLVIKVTLSPPQAYAGADTSVTMNDLVRLRGRASDNGSIAKYEWDFGAKGVFVAVASGDTSVKGPAAIGAKAAFVLRVTDDDGLQDLDTLTATVLSDPPRVDAGKDIWFEGTGSVSLRGIASDLGGVVSKAWDIGAKGNFRTTTGGDTSVDLTLKIGDQIPCIFKAVDDDGETSLDTVWIRGGLEWVEQGTASYQLSWPTGPIESFKGEMWSAWLGDSTDQYISVFHSKDGLQWTKVPTTISRRTGARLKSMLGKLWLFGGVAIPKPGFPTPADPSDIWSSADGTAWTLVAGSSAFSRFCDVVEFKGNMVAETNIGSFTQSNDGVIWSPLPGFATGDFSNCHSLISDGSSLWSFTFNVQSSPMAAGIWKSPDGNQWSQLTNTAVFSKNFYFKPFLLEGNPAVITVDTDELHAWRTPDGGATWAKLSGAAPHTNNTTIKVVQSQGKIWLFVHPGGVNPVRVFRSR